MERRKGQGNDDALADLANTRINVLSMRESMNLFLALWRRLVVRQRLGWPAYVLVSRTKFSGRQRTGMLANVSFFS